MQRAGGMRLCRNSHVSVVNRLPQFVLHPKSLLSQPATSICLAEGLSNKDLTTKVTVGRFSFGQIKVQICFRAIATDLRPAGTFRRPPPISHKKRTLFVFQFKKEREMDFHFFPLGSSFLQRQQTLPALPLAGTDLTIGSWGKGSGRSGAKR